MIFSLQQTLLLFLIFLSTTVFAQAPTGEARYVASPEEGILVLVADGYGKKKTIAFADATQRAFKVLLESGLPGSFQYQPLLGAGPQRVMADNAAFFTNFYEAETYLQFVVGQRRGDFSRRARKTDPNVSVRLGINVPALRRYLEQAGVLRKFGF